MERFFGVLKTPAKFCMRRIVNCDFLMSSIRQMTIVLMLRVCKRTVDKVVPINKEQSIDILVIIGKNGKSIKCIEHTIGTRLNLSRNC